jgi:RNA recognition motif-containing protein
MNVSPPPTVSARPHPHSSPFREGRRAAEFACPPRQPRTRPQSAHIEPSTNIFLNYFPPNFTESDLRSLCAPYGDIVSCKIMINLETGQSKCFGFVRFSNLPQAQAAIHGLNGHEIGNKRLLAKYAESREKEERKSTMIYIKRLPETIDVYGIVDLFSQFGQIVEVTPHMVDGAELEMWRCVVRYSSIHSAAAAIGAMNNQIVVEGTKPIHVRYADESRMSAGPFAGPKPPLYQTDVIGEQDARYLLPSFLFS